MRSSWTRAFVVDSVILAAWLISVGMAVLNERGTFWGGSRRFLSSLGATLEAKEQWFGIYYQDQKVGFSQMSLVPEEQNGVPGVAVKDRGRLSFSLMGAPQQLDVNASAFIDADWRLQVFSASLQSPTMRLEWKGRRQGDRLLITVATPMSTFTKRVDDPTGSAFVTGLSSWAAFHRLKVGQSGKAWVLNPMSMNPEAVYFSVRRRELIDGQDALVVETDVAGLSTTSWVTPEGDVLKETSPLGWELRRESPHQALAPLSAQAVPVDLLATSSVPLDRPLEHPEHITRLVVLLEGIDCSVFANARPWQHPLPAEELVEFHRSPPSGPWCLMELQRPVAPSTRPFVPAEVSRYTRPSPFVQSDTPSIIAKARQIIGAHTAPWEQVAALHQWVFTSVTKQLSVGLPSALDVLATLVGDCHEHTVLFTALARSVGIPTRMVGGLVYWHERLYYHAWPEVWVDQWIPVDPTLGQLVADATHLGLIEAENEQLIALGQFIGKLRVSVLDVQTD